MFCKLDLTLSTIKMSPFFIVAACVLGTAVSCHSDYLPSEEEQANSDTDSGFGGDTSTNLSFGTDSSNDTESDWDVAEIGVVPFSPEQIIDYHITMDETLYDEMQAYGDDEEYREASATIRVGDEQIEFSRVGFRYKGAYSLHHCWDSGYRRYSNECAKLSTKIKFNEYDDNGRFYGLKKINLHAMSGDETKMHERLAYDMFNEFGVDAPRTAFARLTINDDPPVLVLAVEQVDGRYTAHHYPEGGDGNVYKEIWPNGFLTESMVLEQLKTNDAPEDNPDVSRFLSFASVVDNSSVSTFADDMADYVDIEQLLRYMVVDRASKNWDGINAFYMVDNPHNFYWYFDEGGSNQFKLIPWDMDNTFWEYDPYMDLEENFSSIPVPDWNVLPQSCDPINVWGSSTTVVPPGCNNFVNLLAATGWDQFATLGDELLASEFQYDLVDEKVTAWSELIATLVEEDPHIDAGEWRFDIPAFKKVLQKSIEDFSAHLEQGYITE